jgi:hypothetical protein
MRGLLALERLDPSCRSRLGWVLWLLLALRLARWILIQPALDSFGQIAPSNCSGNELPVRQDYFIVPVPEALSVPHEVPCDWALP